MAKLTSSQTAAQVLQLLVFCHALCYGFRVPLV